jgi:hypothetical protein
MSTPCVPATLVQETEKHMVTSTVVSYVVSPRSFGLSSAPTVGKKSKCAAAAALA